MELWERLPSEGQRAFAAFCCYRDLPPGERSLAKVAEKLGKSVSLIERWSKSHDWVRRVKGYDSYLDLEKIRDTREEILQMNRRHLALSLTMQARLIKRLETLDPQELTPETFARWLELATRTERLIHGEPTSISGEISSQELEKRADIYGIDPRSDPVLSSILTTLRADENRASAARLARKSNRESRI